MPCPKSLKPDHTNPTLSSENPTQIEDHVQDDMFGTSAGKSRYLSVVCTPCSLRRLDLAEFAIMQTLSDVHVEVKWSSTRTEITLNLIPRKPIVSQSGSGQTNVEPTGVNQSRWSKSSSEP